MFLDNWLAKVVQESCFITTNEFTFTIKLLADAFIYKTIYLINRLVALKSSKLVDKFSNLARTSLDKPIQSISQTAWAMLGQANLVFNTLKC